MKREYWDTDTGIVRWDTGRTNLNKFIKKFNKWDKNKNAQKGIALLLALQYEIARDDDWCDEFVSMSDEILRNDDVSDTIFELWKIRRGW